MAEEPTAALQPSQAVGGAVGDTELAERGQTTIADRVLETLARRAALEIPGVVRHSTGSDLLPMGSDHPAATVESAGDRVRLRLEVALTWGTAVPEVASTVRQHVRRRVSEQTGKVVDRVDVSVVALLPQSRQSTTQERRVV